MAIMPSISSIGVASVKKCVASYSQRRLRYGYIGRKYSSKRCFTRPSLVTRLSTLVLKVGVVWVAFKRRLVNSVALTVMGLNMVTL